MRLQGKIALITGAASGIGEATAKTFAREGASVVVVDLNEKDGKRVVNEIHADGGVADFHRADVGDRQEIEGMIRAAIDHHGRLDILHNNAAFFDASGHIGEIDWDRWHKTFDVGLTGYMWAARTAIPHMLQQGSGVILNTASHCGLVGDYMLGAYNTMKSGVLNLTRVLAIEYARKGIRANAICPGPIGTEANLAYKAANPERIARVEEAIPMGRLGRPQEMANLALFLASDEASFVTGTFILGDGGLLAHSGMPDFYSDGPNWQ
jgi:meso-butanediol dehydrogenase / (S,S)-butanediol dehydrogenase / diacetyl reductase